MAKIASRSLNSYTANLFLLRIAGRKNLEFMTIATQTQIKKIKRLTITIDSAVIRRLQRVDATSCVPFELFQIPGLNAVDKLSSDLY